MTTKAVIIAPFWGYAQHVGTKRVDRFIRWLALRGMSVVVIKSGIDNVVAGTDWGKEVIVRDPLRIYERQFGKQSSGTRRVRSLVRFAAKLVFCPDPLVMWAWKVAHSEFVREVAADADWVISTSPPESSHVAALKIARRSGANLVIDLRDGWTDEPLKPLLQSSRFQRWREGRLERRMLRGARHIFVTSNSWKEILVVRMPELNDKVVVLTNSYPEQTGAAMATQKKLAIGRKLSLLYAGRFSGSSISRKASLLLEVLWDGAARHDTGGTLTLMGVLEPDDVKEIGMWRQKYTTIGWTLRIADAVPEERLAECLRDVDGLVLLSTSNAAIPSKWFEYLPSGRPILVIAPKGSELWCLRRDLPQVYLADYWDKVGARLSIGNFLECCAKGETTVDVPEEFREEHVRAVFYECLKLT